VSYSVQTFDLAVDRRGDAAEPRNVGGVRIVQCVALPTGAQDVRIRLDEEADYVPLVAGRRFERCNGLISKVTLRNAPTGGILELYAGSDPVPFDGGAGGAGAGVDLLPILHTVWPGGGSNLAGASAFPTTGRTRWGGAFANFWAAKDGAAGDAMIVYRGKLAAGFTQGGGATCGHGVLEGSMYPLLVRPAASTFRVPRQARVWRIRFLMAIHNVAAWTDETGFALLLSAGAAGGWVAGGNAGIGVVGDGAGGWRFVSLATGGPVHVFTESVPLTWPAAPTEYATLTFEIVSANGSIEAQLRIYLNDVPAIARSWGPGTTLPAYTALLNAARFLPYARAGDGALAGSLDIAEVECYAGPCDLAGAEVF
jgi:hypothetical protein